MAELCNLWHVMAKGGLAVILRQLQALHSQAELGARTKQQAATAALMSGSYAVIGYCEIGVNARETRALKIPSLVIKK